MRDWYVLFAYVFSYLEESYGETILSISSELIML